MGLHEVPLSVSLLGFGPMCFRCLIFNLSGPCELLFLHCFIASWT